jgi:hypothetical protein
MRSVYNPFSTVFLLYDLLALLLLLSLGDLKSFKPYEFSLQSIHIFLALLFFLSRSDVKSWRPHEVSTQLLQCGLLALFFLLSNDASRVQGPNGSRILNTTTLPTM